MLFPKKKKKRETTVKDPNELGCDNKHDTNGWVNLSVINVSIESFSQYPDEPAQNPMGRIAKNYQEDTDALKNNLVQYRREAGLSKHRL